MEETKLVPFTKKDVKEHIDKMITHWRIERDKYQEYTTSKEYRMCVFYIDAYQSMRSSLFGELLPM